MRPPTARANAPPPRTVSGFDARHLGSLAAHRFGSQEWKDWSTAVETRQLAWQRPADAGDPVLPGSWDPRDAWGLAGGRVYVTALNVLTLLTRIRLEGRGH